MKYFLLYFACITLLSSCDKLSQLAKNLDATAENSSDKDSKKKNTGLRKQYFTNGNLRSAVNYKDGVKHGEAKNYYDNGKVKLAMTYNNGKREGKSYFYYKDGQLYRESNYFENQLDGIRKIYKNGKLKAEIPYKADQPGKGIKEYLLNGKLKTNYPKIIISPKDQRLTTGEYHLDIYFSEVNPKDEFYLMELVDGKFVPPGSFPIDASKGRARITIDVLPGTFIMKKINIIGVHKTKQGNPYVLSRSYNLSIE